ncbi:uncharacterized [Tachysurus ichikawai]
MSITACSISRMMNTRCTSPARTRCTHADENAQSALPACNPHNGNHSRVISSKPPPGSLYSFLLPTHSSNMDMDIQHTPNSHHIPNPGTRLSHEVILTPARLFR